MTTIFNGVGRPLSPTTARSATPSLTPLVMCLAYMYIASSTTVPVYTFTDSCLYPCLRASLHKFPSASTYIGLFAGTLPRPWLRTDLRRPRRPMARAFSRHCRRRRRPDRNRPVGGHRRECASATRADGQVVGMRGCVWQYTVASPQCCTQCCAQCCIRLPNTVPRAIPSTVPNTVPPVISRGGCA